MSITGESKDKPPMKVGAPITDITAVISVIGAPTFIGGLSLLSPVILINPLIPCATRSNPPL